jgi:hypothetical protein
MSLSIQRPVVVSPLTHSYEQLKDPNYESDMDEIAWENLKDQILQNIPQLMQNISKLNAHALADLCSALYDLYIEDQDLFDVIEKEALEKMRDFNACDLVNVAKAFDAWEDFPAELFDKLQEETLKKCSTFDEVQLHTIMDIFSKYDGMEGFFKTIALHLADKVENYSATGICNISQTFSKVNACRWKLVKKIHKAALANIKKFRPNELATLLYSWTILGIPIDCTFFKRVHFLLSKPKRFKDRSLSMIVRVCGKKNYFNPELLKILRNRLTVRTHKLNPEEIAWSVCGFTTLEFRNMNPLLVNMSKQVCEIAHKCSQEHLGAIAYGFAKANFVDEKLFQCIRSATLSKLDTFTPLHLYTIVNAFAHNKVYDRVFFEKIAEKILSMQDQFENWQYNCILDCYASLKYEDLLKKPVT